MDDATLSLLLSFLLSPDGKIFFGDNVKVGLLKFETEKSRIIFWVSYAYQIHGITYDMAESHMVTSIKIDCQSAMPFSKVPLNCGGHPIDQKLFLIGDFLVIRLGQPNITAIRHSIGEWDSPVSSSVHVTALLQQFN